MFPTFAARFASQWYRTLLSLATLFALPFPPPLQAATPPADVGSAPASVRREILALDARLSEAYAACRTQRLRTLFAADAELVFADRGILRGVSAHLDALRRDGCRQRRETDAEAQQVFAVPGTAGAIEAAIQVGTQVFCAPGAEPCRGDETRFVALWRRTDEGWKIARLIRYGYDAAP